MQDHLWPVSVRLLLANQQLDSPLNDPSVRMPTHPHRNVYQILLFHN